MRGIAPLTQFLNRARALRIAMQNLLFGAFEQLLEARIEAAIGAGIFDVGVETLIAESFHIAERRTICTYAVTSEHGDLLDLIAFNRNRQTRYTTFVIGVCSAGFRYHNRDPD